MPEFAFGDREISTCQRLVYTIRIATALTVAAAN